MKRDFWLVFLVVAAVSCVGIGSYCLLDVDEPRFATASRTMFEGGDWIVPHFNGDERFDKPILVYWFQLASIWLFGATEFAVRLPSALAVALASAIVCSIGQILACRRVCAVFAGLALGTCAQAQIMAHAATADALLLATATCVAYAQFARWSGRRTPLTFMLLWGGLAAAILTKGPPAIVAPMSLALGLTLGERARIRPRSAALGISFCIALVALWAVPAYVKTDGRFLEVGLGKHVVERSLRPFEGHGGFAPWWYLFYVVSVPLTFLPWSGWLADIIAALRRREPVAPTRASSAPGVPAFPNRALTIWLVGTILVFTLVTSKLPHYPLPAFPALALALACAAHHGFRYRRVAAVGFVTCGVVLAAAMVFVLIRFPMEWHATSVVALGASALVGFSLAAKHSWSGDDSKAISIVLATSFVVWIILPRGVLAGVSGHWLHIEKARYELPEIVRDRPLLLYRIVMPSLAWYLGRNYTQLEVDDSQRAIEGLLEPGTRLLLRASRLDDLERAIREADLEPAQRARLESLLASPLWRNRGILAQKGKPEDLLLLGD
ncbi:MAG: glycosyltransferase family 39 protein [Planctomycetes bacterium]|nr:glycosyltransferase family 39 protein [Planctomycetota bacterium]